MKSVGLLSCCVNNLYNYGSVERFILGMEKFVSEDKLYSRAFEDACNIESVKCVCVSNKLPINAKRVSDKSCFKEGNNKNITGLINSK